MPLHWVLWDSVKFYMEADWDTTLNCTPRTHLMPILPLRDGRVL